MKKVNGIKRYISKKIYDKLRQEYLKYYISNIGRIVEEEDKIIANIKLVSKGCQFFQEVSRVIGNLHR